MSWLGGTRPVFAIALLIGCSDDEIELAGMYEVRSVAASMPCGADQPVTGFAPYLKFTRSEFLGATIYNFQDCMDAAGTDCVPSGGLFEALTERIPGGWLGHLTSSSGTEAGGTCVLGMSETRATLDGSHLVIEKQTNEEELPFVDATCNTDEADRRGADMPCVAHERTEALAR